MRALQTLAVVVGLQFLVGTAGATPNFPGALAKELSASQSPDCAVCHEGGRTGRGTVNTAFGRAARDRGLVAGDESSLRGALAKMLSDKVDSNGDGVIDVEELRQGKDPNPAPVGDEDLGVEAPPRYGCSFAPRGPGGGPREGFLFVLVLGAVVSWRRQTKGLSVRP